MRVKEHTNYNPEFPEMFTWGWLDSISLSNVTHTIVNHIEHDLRTPERNRVPGLRSALNIIAEIAEITMVG